MSSCFDSAINSKLITLRLAGSRAMAILKYFDCIMNYGFMDFGY